MQTNAQPYGAPPTIAQELAARRNGLVKFMQQEILAAGASLITKEEKPFAYVGDMEVTELGDVLLVVGEEDFAKLVDLVAKTRARLDERVKLLKADGFVVQGSFSSTSYTLGSREFSGLDLCMMKDDDFDAFRNAALQAMDELRATAANDKVLYENYIAALLAVPRPKVTCNMARQSMRIITDYIEEAAKGMLKELDKPVPAVPVKPQHQIS
jgi:hypothetical protein